MAWTEEMVEELKRLWDEGVTTGEIGRRLNISKNSIVGKVHRLGLSGRPSPIKKKGEPKNETTTNNPAKEKAPKKEAVKVEKKETKEVTVAKEAAPTIEKKASTPKTDFLSSYLDQLYANIELMYQLLGLYFEYTNNVSVSTSVLLPAVSISVWAFA